MTRRELRKLELGERRIAKNKRMSRGHREYIKYLQKKKEMEDWNTELAIKRGITWQR